MGEETACGDFSAWGSMISHVEQQAVSAWGKCRIFTFRQNGSAVIGYYPVVVLPFCYIGSKSNSYFEE